MPLFLRKTSAILLAGCLLFDPASIPCQPLLKHSVPNAENVQAVLTQALTPRPALLMHIGNYVREFWKSTLDVRNRRTENMEGRGSETPPYAPSESRRHRWNQTERSFLFPQGVRHAEGLGTDQDLTILDGLSVGWATHPTVTDPVEKELFKKLTDGLIAAIVDKAPKDMKGKMRVLLEGHQTYLYAHDRIRSVQRRFQQFGAFCFPAASPQSLFG